MRARFAVAFGALVVALVAVSTTPTPGQITPCTPLPFQVSVANAGGGCGLLSITYWTVTPQVFGAAAVVTYNVNSGLLGPFLFQVVGASVASIDLSFVSPGCVLTPFPDVVTPLSPCCGGGCLGCGGLGIPCDASLLGGVAYLQAAGFTPSTSSVTLSNTLVISAN